jgi:hypothetical protein
LSKSLKFKYRLKDVPIKFKILVNINKPKKSLPDVDEEYFNKVLDTIDFTE